MELDFTYEGEMRGLAQAAIPFLEQLGFLQHQIIHIEARNWYLPTPTEPHSIRRPLTGMWESQTGSTRYDERTLSIDAIVVEVLVNLNNLRYEAPASLVLQELKEVGFPRFFRVDWGSIKVLEVLEVARDRVSAP